MKIVSMHLCLLFVLSTTVGTAADLQLHSVNPASANQGATVQILGAGFTSTTRVLLGNQELVPLLIDSGQLQLQVPQFTEGEYTLQLISAASRSAQSLSLRIDLPPPSILSLSPTNIDECSSPEERLVTISGTNFQPGASLLLNGAAVAASIDSQQTISFSAPEMTAGSYGLQVVNPNGKRSLPQSLYFNNIPKISSLSAGDDYVGSYQLIIEGKNFYPHSRLVVREYPTGFGDAPPLQRVIHGRDSGANGDGRRLQVAGDYLNYIDCNRLIYYRFPYSGQDKQLTLQIVNRDGKSSAVESISTP